MKIISYNVNGIRAAMNKGLMDWLKKSQPDVFCVQEIKALAEQVDLEAFEELGFHSYLYSAEKKGYSGVAIFSKEKPTHVAYGCGIEQYDAEGRIIRADFANGISVMSVYVPSASNIDRLDFKMQFCVDFLQYNKDLLQTHPNMVVCGDFNICKEAIDIHDPVRNKNVSGFLPQEREWLAQYIEEADMVDAFRVFEPEPHHYSWWSYRADARNNNKGWRIDYTMVSASLKNHLQRAYILPQAKHSDHAPIGVELDDKPLSE